MENKPKMNIYVSPGIGNSSGEAACRKNGVELMYNGISKAVAEKKDVNFPSYLRKDACNFISSAQRNGYEVNLHIFLPSDPNKAVSEIKQDRELVNDHGVDVAEKWAKSYEEGVANYSNACKLADSATLYRDKPYEYLYQDKNLEVIGKYKNGEHTEGVSVDKYLSQNNFQPQFSANINTSGLSGTCLKM